jgi:hypothetical protein
MANITNLFANLLGYNIFKILTLAIDFFKLKRWKSSKEKGLKQDNHVFERMVQSAKYCVLQK